MKFCLMLGPCPLDCSFKTRYSRGCGHLVSAEMVWNMARFHNFNLLAFEEKARRSKRNELLRCFCVISLVNQMVYCKNSMVAWWAWGPKAAIFFKFISPNCLLGSWIEIIISIQKKKKTPSESIWLHSSSPTVLHFHQIIQIYYRVEFNKSVSKSQKAYHQVIV